MNNIDDLLRLIVSTPTVSIEEELPARDSKALKNIARLIDDPKYITENQAKLVVKILKENVESLKKFRSDIEELTGSPKWARPFRVIQQVRKLYINNEYDFPQIAIETTFSAELQRELVKFSKTIEGFANVNNGKTYIAALTEKNIVEIIDRLKRFKFSVSDDLKEYYATIKSWSKSDVEDQYRIDTISYSNFEKQIIADLGIDTAIDHSVILDRSMRYQYFVKNDESVEKSPEKLSKSIAARSSAKVWVSNNEHSLCDVIQALTELKRMPLLVVLDSRNEVKCLEDLKNLSDSLEKNGIFDGIGVYFRLDNTTEGKEFNQLVATKKYNCHLDASTKIVVVQSGKIPKFLLKTNWKPMSVVSVNHSLRHSKTAVYSNCCDLIVTYTAEAPMIEARHPWE